MAEGWTREETRRKHRWCEGKGYENGAPLCGGKAVLFTPERGHQRCQRCIKKLGIPPTEMDHVESQGGGCVQGCPACTENTRRGLNADGSTR